MPVAWTEERLHDIETFLADGYSTMHIAGVYNVTVPALKKACQRYGISIRERRTSHTVAGMARLMSTTAQTIRRWCARGLLRHEATPRARHTTRWIPEEAVIEFLQDQRYWALWRPERISEPGLRKWAEELRATDELMSTDEIAKHHLCTTSGVIRWLRKGYLTKVTCGPRIYVRRAEVEAFIPPINNPKPKTRRLYSAKELALWAELRRRGWRITEISANTNRPESTIYKALSTAFPGLPKVPTTPMRDHWRTFPRAMPSADHLDKGTRIAHRQNGTPLVYLSKQQKLKLCQDWSTGQYPSFVALAQKWGVVPGTAKYIVEHQARLER